MNIPVNSTQHGQLKTRWHTTTNMNVACEWEVGDVWLPGAAEFKWQQNKCFK